MHLTLYGPFAMRTNFKCDKDHLFDTMQGAEKHTFRCGNCCNHPHSTPADSPPTSVRLVLKDAELPKLPAVNIRFLTCNFLKVPGMPTAVISS